jgi:hypothetical protein
MNGELTSARPSLPFLQQKLLLSEQDLPESQTVLSRHPPRVAGIPLRYNSKNHIFMFAIFNPDSKPMFAPHVCAAHFQTDKPDSTS